MTHATSIALISTGAVLPDAPTPDVLWANLLRRHDAARPVPAGRQVLEPARAFHAERGRPDRVYARNAALVEGFRFDAAGLDLPAELVASLDPSCQLALTAAREAWAGARMEAVDLDRVGVILGNIALPTDATCALTELLYGQPALRAIQRMLGRPFAPSQRPPTHPTHALAMGLPAALIAQGLGLGGPSFTLDAACASSLFALKLAMDALEAGRADAMLVGGMSRPNALYTQMGFSQLRALSPSGRCSPFDQAADGLVVGEGAVVFVLKRLDDALRQGDAVLATVAAVGLSNDTDGALLAPSPDGQLRAMRAAYRRAGWSPHEVDLIECHATGTPVGDAAELRSLRALLADAPRRATPCALGAVKANVGHLLTGAGAVSLLKIALAFKHGVLPPNANFRAPHPELDLSRGPFRVLQAAEPWAAPADRPRRAAVSGFGFGGTNAHVLLEAPRAPQDVFAPPPAVEARRGVVITGAEAHVGSQASLRALQRQLLDPAPVAAEPAPRPAPSLPAASGRFIPALALEVGSVRVPPRELEEILPQQALMLDVARRALLAAPLDGVDPLRVGVFIGIALDLNTSNYHLRWALRQHVPAEAARLGLDAAALDGWIDALADALSPPLNANRTVGGLGSIVASRVAREFGLGGPAFVLCDEDASGLTALEAAAEAIGRGELDAAVVGAVDLCAEPRLHAARELLRPSAPEGEARPFDTRAAGHVPAEGAVALVLRRADQAGRAALATVLGAAAASGARHALPRTLGRAIDAALEQARIEPGAVGLVVAQGSADPREDRAEIEALAAVYDPSRAAMTAATAALGHAGVASGLVSVVAALTALNEAVIPPLPLSSQLRTPEEGGGLPVPTAARFWLHDAGTGPRRAAVSALSLLGHAHHLVLQAPEAPRTSAHPVAACEEALLLLEAAAPAALADAASALAGEARAGRRPLLELAAATLRPRLELPRALALIARSHDDLQRVADEAARALREGRDVGEATAGRAFFAAEPLARQGHLAFVYPGSGSHFPRMGLDIGPRWAEVLRRQERQTPTLRSQLQPDLIDHDDPRRLDDAQRLILAQVALATVTTDLLGSFGVRPRAAIGYSLGETASLFSLGAWTEREEMRRRALATDLFTHQLAGPCLAARRHFGLGEDAPLAWSIGVVNRGAEAVRDALADLPRAFLLIVNTPDECVIGGEEEQVRRVVERLGAHFVPLRGVTTVHCAVAAQVEAEYRALHLLKTTPPPDVRFYSGAWGRSYDVTREAAADSITAQALIGVDFPRTVRAAWDEGARLFIELGPGRSCTRMIHKILADRPHAARSLCLEGQDTTGALLRVLATLLAHRFPCDLAPLLQRYRDAPRPQTPALRRPLHIPTGGPAVDLDALPRPPAPPVVAPPQAPPQALPTPEVRPVGAFHGLVDASGARARAHDTWMRVQSQALALATEQLARQLQLAGQLGGVQEPLEAQGGDGGRLQRAVEVEPPVPPAPVEPPRSLDRAACLEFAVGSIGAVLGPRFGAIDAFPTRVRLPDEPLMLVDRITSIEGEPLSMRSGRVVTEHDVYEGRWYLDLGRIPTAIAIESGQADLFLSGWLGIDRETRGLAMYRLLDAKCTFHDELPRPGDTIRYDIRIERFFQHGDTWLFRFRFDADVNGRPLMSMEEGCAGFFSAAELAAGRGILREEGPSSQARTATVAPLAPLERSALDAGAIAALRDGDLVAAFGGGFAGLALRRPATLPEGLLHLVHRVTHIDREGGRYGVGTIIAEADIHPDDWFLTCHFVDDQVMPGTLMYECCLHTLRVYMMSLGWVGELGEVVFQPVPGVKSRLKCRGQVLSSTRLVTYEIHVRELGYRPEPFAIVDALMYADGKPIVDIGDMTLRLTGTDREALERLWAGRGAPAYGKAQIMEFACGRPSAGYGAAYAPFDDGSRFIARLPRPPLQMIDRVLSVTGEPFVMAAGAECVAEVEIDAEAWYFRENQQRCIPFVVLLEMALQPCGWTSAYVGSALLDERALYFRNLGGSALLHGRIEGGADDTLRTRAVLRAASRSGGMIIHRYTFAAESRRQGRVIYEGETTFGFFSAESLAEQVGLRGASLYVPEPPQATISLPMPEGAPLPGPMLRMVERIDALALAGGPHGLGFVRGSIGVDPGAWFFRAHFFGDPVWPGSLGLEALLQLLKVYALMRWELGEDAQLETMAPGLRHGWTYRGQIVPGRERVELSAVITGVDEATRRVVAEGHLAVDGRVIYHMQDFAVQVVSG